MTQCEAEEGEEGEAGVCVRRPVNCDRRPKPMTRGANTDVRFMKSRSSHNRHCDSCVRTIHYETTNTKPVISKSALALQIDSISEVPLSLSCDYYDVFKAELSHDTSTTYEEKLC